MSDAGLRGGRSRPRNMEPYGDMGDQEPGAVGLGAWTDTGDIRQVDWHL